MSHRRTRSLLIAGLAAGLTASSEERRFGVTEPPAEATAKSILMAKAPPAEPDRRRSGSAFYAGSLAAFTAANALDLHSSWGKFERNPIARGPDGRLSPAKAISLKAGVTAGIIVVEHLVIRKWPGMRRLFAVTNYALAGMAAGVAARNYTIPAPR